MLQFAVYGDNQYLLVVEPLARREGLARDRFIGSCPVFTVIGTYDGKGLLEKGYLPTEQDHLTAIGYLKDTPRELRLGWMGSGFKPLNPDYPCVVASRALQLLGDGDHTRVISWYSPT
ncbi:hypothetical protein [Microbulbifer yueqingensis]|nr:hypothetical protein [Microbulbifer yueqingensis]